MYHGHNVEYEIRKMKNSLIIQLITKYLEKSLSICDYATTVSTIKGLLEICIISTQKFL